MDPFAHITKDGIVLALKELDIDFDEGASKDILKIYDLDVDSVIDFEKYKQAIL